MLSVTIVEKDGAEQTHSFDKLELSIGRVQGNEIVLPKGNISKRHAQVTLEADKITLVDLGSTNGTYVNKQKIHGPMELSPDDKVFIGDFILMFSNPVEINSSEFVHDDFPIAEETGALDSEDSYPATEAAPPEEVVSLAEELAGVSMEQTGAMPALVVPPLVEDPIVFGVQDEAEEADSENSEAEVSDGELSAESESESDAPWPVESHGSDNDADSSDSEAPLAEEYENASDLAEEELDDRPSIIRMDESIADEPLSSFEALAEEPSTASSDELDSVDNQGDEESIELDAVPDDASADDASVDDASVDEEAADEVIEEASAEESCTFEQYCELLATIEGLTGRYLYGDLDPHTMEFSNDRLHEIVNEVVEKAHAD
ncbi:MAG TPA: FHA domain-containing protein, partial [Myxococcales bacterium]|nr:FHA domain-containing protein [Myxococcales bacterium]